MKVLAVLFYTFILLCVSDSFELTKESVIKLFSNSSELEEEYLEIYKNVQKEHFLNQLFIEQDSVIPIDQSNGACFQSIAYLLSQNLNGKSFHFLDSWGSIPAGILYGHLMEIGNIDECLSARATIEATKEEIRGKYVLVKFGIAGQTPVMGALEVALKVGTCFPHTCSDETVRKIFQTTINQIPGMTNNDTNSKLNIGIHSSKTQVDEITYSAGSIVAISIFSVIGALMLFSTIYDYVMMKKKTPANQLLIAFSVLTNSRKLFYINTNISANNIDCLNGLRVLSMMWIIYGHCHIFVTVNPLINLVEYLKDPFSMLVQASPFGVDSFLLISGLVLTCAALNKMEKTNGKLNVPLMYLQRYLRLTPILAACILVVVGISPLLDRSPLQDWSIREQCKKTWWINLLYLNNILSVVDAVGGICVGQAWYIAVDMQLFIMAPIFLFGLWKWKSKFLWLILLVILLSFGCCVATIIYNDINGIIAHGLYIRSYTDKVHVPTYIRISSWLIGVALGYWFYSHRNKKLQLNTTHLTIGWTLAVGLIVAVVYPPYSFSKDLSASTPVEAAMFSAFGRIAWSLSLSWVIFTCHTGYSRTLNSFLSHPGWQPIARLTYSMYMVSMTLQEINVSLVKVDSYFSVYKIIQTYSSDLVLSLVLAIIAVLALESPIIALTKYFFEGKKKEKSNMSA